MKAVMLYRPGSEHSTAVEAYLRDFKVQTGKDLPTLDVDSVEGAEKCKLYEIMEYPAVLVTDDDGRQQNLWTGQNLPRFNEVSYYIPESRQLDKRAIKE